MTNSDPPWLSDLLQVRFKDRRLDEGLWRVGETAFRHLAAARNAQGNSVIDWLTRFDRREHELFGFKVEIDDGLADNLVLLTTADGRELNRFEFKAD